MSEETPGIDLMRAIGLRLRATRLALTGGKRKKTAGAVAEHYCVSSNRWSQWETGKRAVNIWTMKRFCDENDGITLDWILRGETGGLTTARRDEIAGQMEVAAEELKAIWIRQDKAAARKAARETEKEVAKARA